MKKGYLIGSVCLLISLVSAVFIQPAYCASGTNLWGDKGVVITTNLYPTPRLSTIYDNNNGFVVGYDASSSFNMQRVGLNGKNLWVDGGINVGSNARLDGVLVPTSTGDILVIMKDNAGGFGGSEFFGQRINTGGITQLLPSSGVYFYNTSTYFVKSVAIPDGNDGALFTWSDRNTNFDTFINRADSNMLTVAGWIPRVVSASNYYDVTGTNRHGFIKMTTDGDSGAFMMWADYDNTGKAYNVSVSRMLKTGTSEVGSTINGQNLLNDTGTYFIGGIYQVTTPIFYPGDPQYGICSLINNEAMATYLMKKHADPTYSRVFIRAIGANGTPQYVPNGTPVCNVSSVQSSPKIVSDGVGGAIVCWLDQRSDQNEVYIQRLTRGGAYLWNSAGIRLSTPSVNSTLIDMISDNSGGAYIAWWDNANNLKTQHIDMSGNILWDTNGFTVKNTTGVVEVNIATDSKGLFVTWAKNTGVLYGQYVVQGMPTVYISPSGSDDTGNGTSMNPFATLHKGLGYVAAYGEVRAKSGVYTLATSEFQGINMGIWPIKEGITLTMDPMGSNPATFDAMGRGRHISFEAAVNFVIKNVHFVNGFSSFESSILIGNNGGSIYYPYITTKWATIEGCTFYNNKAGNGPTIAGAGMGGSGGALFVGTNNMVVKDSNFINNLGGNGGLDGTSPKEGGYGGAICFVSSSSIINHYIQNCYFTGNKPGTGNSFMFGGGGAGAGGALYYYTSMNVLNNALNISNSSFIANTSAQGGGYAASSHGGAISITGIGLNMSISTFEGNYTATAYGNSGKGGAIYSEQNVTAQNCTFRFNYTGITGIGDTGDGGAIYQSGGYCNLTSSYFEGNYTGEIVQAKSGSGGAVDLEYTNGIVNCVFINNRTGSYLGSTNTTMAGDGGALNIRTSGIVNKIVNNTFIWNNTGRGASEGYGGAIAFIGSSGVVTNCAFAGNSKYIQTSGQDVYSSGVSAVVMNNCFFKMGEYGVDGNYVLNNMVSGEPLFVSQNAPYDLQLQELSPCVRAGTSAGAPIIDFLGNPRGPLFDIGAYQFTLTSAPNITRVTANGVTFVSGDVMKPDVVIDIYVTDTQGISTASLYIDGSVIPKNLTLRSGTIYDGIWTTSITLGVGRHDIRVLTVDPSGKNRSTSYSAIVLGGGLQMVGEPFNYPNPFRPLSRSADSNATNIQYTLNADAPITLIIYNISGNEVKRISSPTGQNGGRAGINSVVWNGKNLGNETVGDGMYIYKIISGGKVIGGGKLVVLDQ